MQVCGIGSGACSFLFSGYFLVFWLIAVMAGVWETFLVLWFSCKTMNLGGGVY